MKGRAALYYGPEKGFQIQELPTPEVEPGGVLVRVTAASVCGSDLHYWRRGMPPERLPRITGHEFCGRVHTLGQGVTTDSLRRPLKEGDRVAFPFIFPCMRCYHCVRGELNVCQYRYRRNLRYRFEDYPYCDGGFAEYFYLPPGHFVFKVPDELPDEAVAPVNCALAQVTFALDQVGVRPDDTVAIQGAGGLGIYAAAVARQMGAGRVISIDAYQARLDLALRCGATDVVNISQLPEPEDRVQAVREMTGGIGVDLVVEVAGVPAAFQEGLAMVRKGGTYVTIGNIPARSVDLPLSSLITGQQRIVGVAHYNPWVILAALDFLVQTRDRYALLDVVSQTYPLERINDAFRAADWSGRGQDFSAARTVVKP